MERNWLTQMPSYRCRSETDGMRISSETDGWDERAVDPRRARCKQQTAGSSSRICGVQNESQNEQFTVCVSDEEKNNQFTCIKLVIRINGKYELQETIK